VTTRRARIPPRRRFFLGCEGESEQSYGALLQILADESLQLHVHLDLQLLGGGDPLAIVEAAVQKSRERARKRGRFVRRGVLLDSDRHGHAPERDNGIAPLAQAHGLLLIWQRPCHEALLLRHLPRCQTLRPSSSAAAEAALVRQWPEYQKPMPTIRLAEKLGLSEIQSAAQVEDELRGFLSLLRFPIS
jgi:hypothetical protein